MRIECSNLAMQGSSYTATAVSSYQTQEAVGIRLTRPLAEIFSGRADSFSLSQEESEIGVSYGSDARLRQGNVVSLGNLALERQEPQGEVVTNSAAGNSTNAVGSDLSSLPPRDRLRMMVLESLMQRLTGKASSFKYSKLSANVGYTSSGTSVQALNTRLSRTIRSTFTTVTKSESQISFEAQGSVRTADGRTINLNLNFNVSQSVEKSTSIITEMQQRLCDPLVINFSGPMPQFTGDTMSFDIDCDGKEDQIGKLSAGSGYLAIDKNGNGKIDDGNELFGPKTNHGYKELAEYDEDGNGWIDENDSIFDSLKIWCSNENGEMQLVALKDKDVGAIYLGSVSTTMDLYSGTDNMARVRESGLVLLENGESRVMQEMDLRI